MFLLARGTHRMVMRHHPTIGHIWVPNQFARVPHERGGYVVRTNGQGFRSDTEFRKQRGKKPRILFFGDSVTAGDGCNNDERFPEVAGNLLDAEVYNYGLSGSGTDQQLLIFEEFAKDVDADLIVIGITIHNIERIKAAYRPTVDRVTGHRLLVPKPYFTLDDGGDLRLNNVPVPIDRPEDTGSMQRVHQSQAHREANPQLNWAYRMADALRATPRLEKVGRFLSPITKDDHTALRAFLLRQTRFDPYPEYRDLASEGGRLMNAIVQRFVETAEKPVLIIPIPDEHYFLTGLKPGYQQFFERFAGGERAIHVADMTSPLRNLTFAERKRLYFEYDPHFSPYGNQKVGEIIADEIRTRRLLPGAHSARPIAAAARTKPDGDMHILGVSCFYHNSAASLITDGRIVAAAEEERFTRIKADRRFPANAINYCLEQAGIDVNDLTAIVYYDSVALTFERLMSTAVEVAEQGLDLWTRMVPSWSQYKLHVPRLIRRYLKYDGLVLQDLHHRSHAASAFYPSPFAKAAILTIDGVGEWATASIGVGELNKVELLKDMRFPHSLGLLYSAFTQFIGFKVNDGEYKMMGLAPYGRPEFVDTILEHIVDLKEDGSVELNLEHFAFVTGATMTNDSFAALFGAPPRKPEDRITQREMDIARSVQFVTEEAMLRMAREARRLTGATELCMAGGVALNCVANGRILREGPFERIWIQPAAGDSGASLGAALDVYHSYYEKPRRLPEDDRSMQRGSHLGPQFSDDEIKAFLETYGYPYRELSPEERPDVIAETLDDGKVVGHFAGRSEFGPRALGSRSILGDPRDQEMQVTLNLKVKYRESFRPFAPVVLAERVADYFELDRESPYMLIVAPVNEARRLPYDPGEGEDLLEKVRRARSDLPAITHVDYSARIQTIAHDDHAPYYDVLEAFQRRNGCGVLVNTSFNVRGEPIVNTPEDAYRCFMRTDMDVLALGNCLLQKQEQPRSTERKGHLEGQSRPPKVDDELVASLVDVWTHQFLPLVQQWKSDQPAFFGGQFKHVASRWHDHTDSAVSANVFDYPQALLDREVDAQSSAQAIVDRWTNQSLARLLKPIVVEIIATGCSRASKDELVENVSESIYVMF
ncbi:MAG: carbamoyltransferase N-terminal domain-containing protein [Gammaproteobacteria bacterium]